MKAKENVRTSEVWDPELTAIQTTAMTDWDILTNPPGGQSLDGYKDVVIRVLLEICFVDPDLYKGLKNTISSCHELRDLVLKAVELHEARQKRKHARDHGEI
jgi:hypothetical protein